MLMKGAITKSINNYVTMSNKYMQWKKVNDTVNVDGKYLSYLMT